MNDASTNAGYLPVIAHNIPKELETLEQWIVWREEPGKEGKPTKVPYRALASERRRASSTDPATWDFFSAAYSVYQLGGYDGIGFAPQKGDPYVFGDLDHCRDPETGMVEQWAQDIVNEFDTYTEVSPSGCGLRFFTIAVWPSKDKAGTSNQKLGIEIYSASHYLTVTGQHLEGTPLTIEERGSQVASLYKRLNPEPAHIRPNSSSHPAPLLRDERIIELGMSESSPKFRNLFSGGTADYGSASEADLALASKLSFYTQDAAQIERLMFSSKLVRGKWGRQTYIRPTIQKALLSVTEKYKAPYTYTNGSGPAVPATVTRTEAPPALNGLVRLSDVLSEHVTWLWPGRIPLGKLTILDGDPGLGKSMITCDLAARVSTGREMPDGEYGDLDGPAGVILLSAEDGLADTIRPRLDAAGADTTRIAALTHVVDDDGLMRPPSVADICDLEQAIAITGAKLVVVDPVMAYLPEKTKSHNDQEVRRVLTPLSDLAERTGVAVLMLRHLNKAPGGNPLYRGGGSIAFIGAVRSGLLAAQDPEDDSGLRRIIASTKSNLAMAPQALAYHVVTSDNGAARIVWEGNSSHTAASLLTVIDAEEKSQLADAEAFLLDLLQDGECAVSEVEKKARMNGIAKRTLDRAKSKLSVQSHKRGAVTDAHWVWALLEDRE